MNATLTSDHIDTLRKLDGLVHQGKDIYEEVKSVSDLAEPEAVG